MLLAIVIGFAFLQGKGSELVERRIEYGLLYSKDDIRWEMYNDSLGLIRRNPLFGGGLGSWSSLYPQVMNPELAGIVPVYLHSDPLQFIAEAGISGLIIFGFPFVLLFAKAISKIANTKTSAQDRLRLGTMLSGILALFLASLFDFPFHIPAINFYLAIFLAVTVFYLTIEDPKSDNS